MRLLWHSQNIKVRGYRVYWRDVWRFTNSNEYEFKYPGKYGAKGEKRAKKVKATPEQIKKQNQTNREKRVRRMIKANFLPNDLWCTLKYPEGTRLPVEQIKKDLKTFLEKMRKGRKKKGEPFKYICRMEIGELGGIHVHILVNRSEKKPNTDIEIQQAWTFGNVDWKILHEAGGYKKLADYIVKPPNEEEAEQLSLFPEEEKKKLKSYSTSKNLIRPEPERDKYTRRTVRKLIEEGPKPTPGYYIDQETVDFGKNPYTGMSYLHYTEVRIKEIHSGMPRGGGTWNSE